MSKILLVYGFSGAGKTTAVNYLASKYSVPVFSPFRFNKAFLERLYSIPEGGLDTREWKSHVPTGMSISMQRLMVEQFVFWADRDPEYTCRNMKHELPEMLKSNELLIVEGIRTLAEASTLRKMVNQGHELGYLRITSPRAQPEPSDLNYSFLNEIFHNICTSFFPLMNDGSMEHYHERLDASYEFLTKNPTCPYV